MVKVTFPSNPSNGMIFEPVSGLYYQYNAKEKSWVRIEKIDVGLATPVADGLMSSEDLKKLNNLIIPPPQTTITGEDCPTVFNKGTISIYSTDESIIITPNLDMNNGQSIPWKLHDNTSGYDFKININDLTKKIEELNRISKVQISGPEGPQGYRGEDGISKLDTGPKGEPGEDAPNSPFGATLSVEPLQFEVDEDLQNRAIVDITTEKISTDENYIKVTRANIGNPDACPTEVEPKNFNTPWMVVIDQQNDKVVRKLEKTGDCQITCKICVSSLYYLNIESILSDIRERFQAKIYELKYNKELALKSWLKTMVALFNEQKYALCCALENCITRERGKDVRRYIEQQRIQAAISNKSLIISNSEEDKRHVAGDADKSCSVTEDEIGETNRITYGKECDDYLVTINLDARIHNRDPRTGVDGRYLRASLPAGEYILEVLDCCSNFNKNIAPKPRVQVITQPPPLPLPPPPLTLQPNIPIFEVRPKTAPPLPQLGPFSTGTGPVSQPPDPSMILPNMQPPWNNFTPPPASPLVPMYSPPDGFQRGATTNIQVTPITIRQKNKLSGRAAIVYNASLPNEDGSRRTEKKSVEIPDLGFYEDYFAARHAYVGVSTLFIHSGGAVDAWIPDPDRTSSNNDGGVVIGIRSKKCIEAVEPVVEPTTLYVYRDEIAPTNLIGTIKPYESDDTHHINYGYDGTNANLKVGPEQEYKVAKTFFVDAADGLGFYLIVNKKGEELGDVMISFVTVEGNNQTLSAIVRDDNGEIQQSTVPQGEEFLLKFGIGAETDGTVVAPLDTVGNKDWIITVDKTYFGDIYRFSAIDANGDEYVLAQGAQGTPIPDTSLAAPFILCRALTRSCNVPEGFGGRFSLGVANRIKGTDFRLCRVIPDWSLNSYIRQPIAYAPMPYPCGANVCDIKHQVIVGSDGQIISIDSRNNNTNRSNVDGSKVDLAFVIDQSGSMNNEFKFLIDRIQDFADYLATQGIDVIRYALITFGGPREGVNKAPGERDVRQGDPILRQDFTTSVSDFILALESQQIGGGWGGREPGLWATEWTASNMAWGIDSVRTLILITDEDSDNARGVDVNTVGTALSNNDILFNVIVNPRRGKTKQHYGNPSDLNNPQAGGTGLAYSHGGTLFDVNDLRNSVVQSHNGNPYDQIFRNFRIGFGELLGGQGSPEAGSVSPLTYNGLPVSGTHVIFGTVKDREDNRFRGALVNIKTNKTRNKVIASGITDDVGQYKIPIPIEFFTTTDIEITVEVELYAIQTYDEWSIDNPRKNTSSTPQLRVSGGGFGTVAVNEGKVWNYGDEDDPILTTNSDKFTVRGTYDNGSAIVAHDLRIIENVRLNKVQGEKKIIFDLSFQEDATRSLSFNDFRVRMIHEPVSCTRQSTGPIQSFGPATGSDVITPTINSVSTIDVYVDDSIIEEINDTINTCGVSFFDRFKKEKLDEIKNKVVSECNGVILGGPSPVFRTVESIPMNNPTLSGKVISIVATSLSLPGLIIKASMYDKVGRGITMRPIETSMSAIWQTHSWQRANAERYINPLNESNIESIDITLSDLKSIAFDFINPPTGVITYIGEVKVAVEVTNDAGSREVVLVDISNFEPWSTGYGETGEIPFVTYINGTPTEEDFSAYLENFWTIASTDKPENPSVCNRLKEFCPDCVVTRIESIVTSGSGGTGFSDDTVVNQEIVCADKSKDMLIPNNAFLFTPIGPNESCLLSHTQVEWYERGWRIGACCGAIVDYFGSKWIIVKRSIGTDTSCGGGESLNTKCVSQFIENGEGHPAIAWPTVDYEEFLGRPTSGFQRLIKDPGLSEYLLNEIATGNALELRGNLTSTNVSDKIPFILFPAQTESPTLSDE